MENKTVRTKRYALLDGIRGLALVNMVVYHGVWDLVYLFGCNWKWYQSQGAYIWQQGICWTFILLSGFCLPLGRRSIKRGLLILLAGCLIFVATAIVTPQNRIIFGVLTLIGSAMLLTKLLSVIFDRWNGWAGFIVSLGLFIVTRNVNEGYLGFEGWNICRLPGWLYQNLATAYLGFPPPGFASSDYFSLFPWIFLYLSGYFLYSIFNQYHWLDGLKQGYCGILEWAGRRSLIIYLLHQPVLYFCFTLLFHSR